MNIQVELTADGIRIPRDLFGKNTALELIVQDDFALVRERQDAAPRFSVDERREQMQREVAAFIRQHSLLVKMYAGQFVAFHDEQMVDVDADRQALRKRIHERFEGVPVLIRQVQPKSAEPLRLGSIRTPHS